jgi:hypothetical protein
MEAEPLLQRAPRQHGITTALHQRDSSPASATSLICHSMGDETSRAGQVVETGFAGAVAGRAIASDEAVQALSAATASRVFRNLTFS